ncbi:MAG: hypothetical protein RL272_797 [Candidatus Parcubacteria bacterium]
MTTPKENALKHGYDRAENHQPYGHCSVSCQLSGAVIVAPFVVPGSAVGRRLVLHESVVRMMAATMNIIPVEDYDIDIAQRDATIEELEEQIKTLTKENETLRWAAEQYFAANPSKPTSERGAAAHAATQKEQVLPA